MPCYRVPGRFGIPRPSVASRLARKLKVRSGPTGRDVNGGRPLGGALTLDKSRQHSLERARVLVSRIIAERHDRPSLVSEIACVVGAEIIEGQRLPGDDLNSVELSKRFDTSRTPIREALLLLEKEGLVDVKPRRRPRVASLSLTEIREIYHVRAALFEIVATDVARTVTAEGIRVLAGAVAGMARACRDGDLDAFVWANLDFYEHNTQFANNRTVKRIMDSLVIRTARLRRLSLEKPARMAQSLDDHARILRAYEDRDAALAAALIRSNHINALAALENNMFEGSIAH
ncbi:MAG: FCD domain-containing protein [Rhizobiales bacterium]|nr:FCD domain-containing protein [Hyphomicrobiales bacterium]